MISLLFVFFGLLSAQENVRVLLSEEGGPQIMEAIGAISFSTALEKVNIYSARNKIRIKNKNNQWQIEISHNQLKEIYALNGEKLRVESLEELIWKNQKINFPVEMYFRENRYSLIGVMDMNRYLVGVIPHEMPGSWPLEALKAQVVASRSYALWKIQNQKNAIYDLKPSVMDQVFQLPPSFESSSSYPRVEQAILATTDQYLVSLKNKIVKTYFHSDCGGETSTPQEIWGMGATEHASAKDMSCGRRGSEWNSYFDSKTLSHKIFREVVIPSQVQLQDVVIRTQSKTQRAEWVDLLFTKGLFKRVRGEDLRRLLGYDKIKSTLFAIKKQGQGWIFSGRGFGHGVGLCQYGAKSMAESGLTYKQILSHYYPDSQLSNIHSTVTKNCDKNCDEFLTHFSVQ